MENQPDQAQTSPNENKQNKKYNKQQRAIVFGVLEGLGDQKYPLRDFSYRDSPTLCWRFNLKENDEASLDGLLEMF